MSSSVKGKAKKSERITSFVHNKTTYKVGDCVLVRGEGGQLPFVGKIKDISQSGKTVKVQLAWFYRPEEALGGRKQFHGERELFKSDHLDWALASTINCKCHVHSLKTYQSLKKVEEEDFFARFTYKPTTHEFRPDRVPVYCECEMPYNPDQYMIMCDKCEEWYHPTCLGVDMKEMKAAGNFRCNNCAQEQQTAKKQKTKR